MRLVNWRSLAIAAAGFGLAACGDDVTVTPPPITYTVNPQSVTCVAGAQTAVGLTVSGGSGTPTVTFTPGSTTVITGGNASGNTFTFTCGNAAGASAINFTITSGGQSVSGSIPVTVTGAAPSPVTSVAVTPTNASVVPGGTVQLTAQVTLASGAPANTSTAVTWASSDTTVATVSATGLVTAKTTAANKSAVITATSVANTNLTGRAAISVLSAGSVISNLSVSPGAVTLTPGQTQQITSNVTVAPGAPANTSTAVTYVSSDTSIAKVSSTGVITAGAKAGVATITVASEAAPTVTQTIGVTVTALAPVRLTIQGLQSIQPNGQAVITDPTNVAGRLVATLNLDPGSFTPDSVVATLGSQRVVCQRFSVALANALRSAVNDGSADVAPIQCTLNTSAFNATTGVPDVQNGKQQFNATVYYRPTGGNAASTQTATVPTELVLNNQSGFFVGVTNTPTAAQVANGAPANGQATGPQGVLWRAGSVNLTVVPVFFGGSNQGTGSQTLNVTLSDVNNPNVATKQATFTPGSSFSVTFDGKTGAYTPTPANNTLDGYSSPNADQANGGTTVTVGGVTQVVLNDNGVPQAGGVKIYVDNAAPESRTQSVSANFLVNAQSGFINGSFVFADSVTQATATTALADNNGVDRVTRSFFFAENSGGIDANAIVANGTSVTNGSQIPQNISASAFVAAAKLVDALGNAVNAPVSPAGNAGTLLTFGVITAAPDALNVTGGTIGSNAQFGASATGVQNITFSASSASGATFPANFIVGTLSVLRPNGGTICAVAADVTAGAITGVSTTTTSPPCPTLAFNSVTIDVSTAPSGIYTLSGRARDVAGNLGPVFTRTFVVDRTPPTVINPQVTSQPLTGGQSETFSATASDDFGLVAQLAAISYPTTEEILLRYSGSSLGSSFAAPFTKNANLSVGVPFFIRGVAYQAVTPGSPNCGGAAGCFENVQNGSFTNANSAAVGASDVAANWAYAGFQPGYIAGILDQSSSQAAPTIFGGQGPQNVSIKYQASTASSATVGGLPTTLNPATSGVPSSFTINVVQNGPANTPINNQITRVEIWQRSALPQPAPGTPALPFGTTNAYRLVGTCGGAVVSISTTTSTITNTCTVTPGASLGGEVSFSSFRSSAGTTNVNLLVTASTANGYALAFVIPQVAFTTP